MLKAPALICNNTVVPYHRRGNIGTPCNGTRPTVAQCAEALAPEPVAELWTVLGVQTLGSGAACPAVLRAPQPSAATQLSHPTRYGSASLLPKPLCQVSAAFLCVSDSQSKK